MNKVRWGISKKKKAMWLYKRQSGSRSMCWMWTKDDVGMHFKTCDLTNLEYLEGLNKIKELI